jgi:replicative superfamily II helicase
MMTPRMTEADALAMLSMSSEFENISVRQDEMMEMKKLQAESVCDVKGQTDTNYGKTNVLLQAYISKAYIDNFALVSDVPKLDFSADMWLRMQLGSLGHYLKFRPAETG